MFSKCIIFLILFAIAGNIPYFSNSRLVKKHIQHLIYFTYFNFLIENASTTTPSPDNDITDKFNSFIFNVIRPFAWSSYDEIRNNTDGHFISQVNDLRFQNGIHFYNVTLKYLSSPSLKIRLSFYENAAVSRFAYLNYTNNKKSLHIRNDLKYLISNHSCILIIGSNMRNVNIIPKRICEKYQSLHRNRTHSFKFHLLCNRWFSNPN